jgi:hypothetical protein
MKKIHVFIRFHLVKISLYTLLLSSIFSCSLDSSEDSQCQGILCEFFDELNVQFEETGLEKDQGYVFLKSHSENDSTTQRIIIRSMSGIYYAYPSKEGWYAQKKNADEKFTINELGHFLAEKEREAEMQVNKLYNDAKMRAISELKDLYQWHAINAINRKFKIIDTAQFNNLCINKNFLAKELDSLKRGEKTYYEFAFIFEAQTKPRYGSPFFGSTYDYGKMPQIGFYKGSIFYPIVFQRNWIFDVMVNENKAKSIEYDKRDAYLIKEKIVQTALTEIDEYSHELRISYNSAPLIYIPQEKKWYGIDKFADIIKKYGILNSKK